MMCKSRCKHTQPGTIIPASCRNPASRHSRCHAHARTSGLAEAEQTKARSQSTRTRILTSSITERTHSPAPSSRHHADTQHPGTADAAHKHARAGLRERNGAKPTRGARATCPATSQHRVGRQRRGSDERRRTLLFARELLRVPANGEPASGFFVPKSRDRFTARQPNDK